MLDVYFSSFRSSLAQHFIRFYDFFLGGVKIWIFYFYRQLRGKNEAADDNCLRSGLKNRLPHYRSAF